MIMEAGDICPIGVFDSGFGGLSVLTEIQRLLPHEKLIYVGDSENAPYGDRSADFVRQRSLKIAEFLLDQGVKAIVVACNTATAEAASVLREVLDVPVIGLEPAIKPAAKLSKSGVIGVLATYRTISSERLLGLTERYARDKKVLAQACPGLVEQVEACELHSQITHTLLSKYIQPLLDQGVDALILGCTHYPFLLPEIRTITGTEIEILETGKPVAIQLQRILKQFSLEKIVLNEQHMKNNTITLYNSSSDKQVLNAMQRLWQITSAIPIEIKSLPALN
jgi:glutamate racemase